jgi:hypothetical protein
MFSVVGIYENGYLKFDKDYSTKNPVKVIVTFLEDMPSKSDNGLTLTDFSFSKSKKNLQSFKGSFADTVIDERRADL